MMMKAYRRLAVVLALLPACVDPGSGNGGTGEGGGGGKADDETMSMPHTITASWQIKDIAATDAAECPDGYDTVALTSQRIDPDGEPVGAPVIDLFNCADDSGTTADLGPGRYRIWLDITTNDGLETYAQSTSTYVDLTEYDASVSFQILRDGGYFSLAWDLIGATSGDPLECSQVADLDGVELIATLANTTSVITDLWDCADGSGVTAGLAAGTYTVSVDAMNDEAGALGYAPTLADREILPLNKVTELGTVTIEIDGM